MTCPPQVDYFYILAEYALGGNVQGRVCAQAQVTVSIRQDVAPDNTTIFDTITTALNAFLNVIEVFPGQYDENITIASEVVLKSTEDPLFTCINEVLGVSDGAVDADINNGGRIDAVDMQH